MVKLIKLISPHAKALGCLDEAQSAASILDEGTSATRQVSVLQNAMDKGADKEEALKEVVRTLIAHFSRDIAPLTP